MSVTKVTKIGTRIKAARRLNFLDSC